MNNDSIVFNQQKQKTVRQPLDSEMTGKTVIITRLHRIPFVLDFFDDENYGSEGLVVDVNTNLFFQKVYTICFDNGTKSTRGYYKRHHFVVR